MDAGSKRATFALLRQLARAIERLFRPHCEVVIHDFADLEHSIVHLEGAVSDRAVGGAATNLLLQRVAAGATAGDLHNYRTQLADGRVMRSSTVFLRDAAGTAYGALCINYDITALAGAQRVLADMIRIDTQDNVSEILSDDIDQTIGGMIAETIGEMGGPGSVLSREHRIALIARLDQKGVFRVRKAVAILARQFGSSRATIYNYLRASRGEEMPPRRKKKADAQRPSGKEARLGAV